MKLSFTKGWNLFFLILLNIGLVQASNNLFEGDPEKPMKITSCDDESNEVELVFNNEKDWNPLAPPFECGMSVTTSLPFIWPVNDLNAKVMHVIDIRNHASAPVSPSNDWTAVHPLYEHADWTMEKMGHVFGIAIDGQYNIYATTTAINGHQAPGTTTGAGAGTIYKADATTGAISVFANLPNSTLSGTVGAGLGNVCYNPDNDLLYVSNFYDGKIYCLNMTGTIVAIYDPVLSGTATLGSGFHDPSSTAYQIERGQRIWGLGYYDGTLYFGVWRENTGYTSALYNNEVWSVGLTGTGLFPGVTTGNPNGDYWQNDNLEKSFPQFQNSPISDIAFSSDGSDLFIGTRTMSSTYSSAHSSSVWKVDRASIATSPVSEYYVGNGASKKNCAGGIDIGYESVKIGENPEICDAKVWSTGDYLTAGSPAGTNVYGVAGIPFTGNTTVTVSQTSVYIDLDNTYAVNAKTKLGDIEIFKCGCKDTSVVDIPRVCDSISIQSTLVQGEGEGCCFELTVDNSAVDFFSYVELQTTGGTSISSFMSLGGWLPQSYSATNLVMAHPSGVIPPGSNTFAKVCLSEYYSGPQSILVNYYDMQGHVVCTDPITVECTQDPACINVVQDSISCSPKVGEYLYEFCINSNAMIGWNVNSIVLNPPPGVTMSPNTFSVADLAPGMTTCTFTTAIVGALPGEEICFSVTGHSENVFQQEQPLNCCTDTVDLVCIIMPDCSPCSALSAELVYQQQAAGGCCWDIELTNSYDDNYFTAVSTELITPGVNFSSIMNMPGSGWFMNDVTPPFSSTHAQFKPFPPFGGFIGSNATLPTICIGGVDDASEIPQAIVVHWWVGDEIMCSDTVYADCPIVEVEDGCAEITHERIVCGEEENTYVVTFDIVNNSGHDIQEIDLTAAPGFTLSTTNFVTTILAGATLTGVSTIISGVGAGPACFNVTLHQIDEFGNNLNCCTTNNEICFDLPDCPTSCGCGGFSNIGIVQEGQTIIQFSCGKPTQVDCPDGDPEDFTISGVFNCEGNCDMEGLTWQIVHNEVVEHSGSMTMMGTNFSFVINSSWFEDGGNYQFTLSGRCGNEVCTCDFTLVLPDDCGSDCCKDEEAFNDTVNAAFKTILANQTCDTLCFEAIADSCITYCINWGDETEEDCLSEGEICHIFTDTNTSIGGQWYYVCLTAKEYSGENICFEKQICDSIFVKACDTDPICECGAFDKVTLLIDANNPNENIDFHCGGEPVDVGCPPNEDSTFPIQGIFNCHGDCDMEDLNWSITHNGTMIQSGSMTTTGMNFSFDINTLWFQEAGQYNFTLTGKCGDEVCRCRFSMVVPEGCNDECCQDEEAFYDAANNAFNHITMPNCGTLCLEVPQDTCMEYCINWGDQTEEDCITDGKICHDFDVNVETSFEVCLTATSSTGDSICFETKICKSFIVKPCPAECGCGGFTGLSMTFPDQHGEKLECGKEFKLGCPKKDTKYAFRGWYNCEGQCEPEDLNWSLSYNGAVIHDGALLTGGFGPSGIQIGATLPSGWFTNPGVYELTYSGSCNGKKCDCTIKLIVDEDCGCNCDTFNEDVAQGFLGTVPVELSCKSIFTPVALTECDEVHWTIEDESGVVHTETTMGNTPIDFDFTSGKDYLVTMTVVRTDENGKVCKSEYFYKFTAKCDDGHAVCTDDIIKNPGFTSGLDDWKVVSGKPYVNKAMGSQDEGFLVLKGNAIAGDAVRQVVENNTKEGENFVLSFDIKSIGASKGDRLFVSICVSDGIDDDCNGGDEDDDFIIDLGENTEEYVTKSFRKRPGRTKYANITLKRSTSSDDGNKGEVHIDNVCLSIVDSLNVANEDVQFTETISFYPNPINNTLNIELETPSTDDISIVIRDIWGREMATSEMKKQTTQKMLDFSNYSNGVFIIEMTKSNGERYYEKVIKQ